MPASTSVQRPLQAPYATGNELAAALVSVGDVTTKCGPAYLLLRHRYCPAPARSLPPLRMASADSGLAFLQPSATRRAAVPESGPDRVEQCAPREPRQRLV